MTTHSSDTAGAEPRAGAAAPSGITDDRVRRLKTPKDCQIFMKNAAERGRPDLAAQARRQAILLRTDQSAPNTPLERAWYESLHAREDILTKNGAPIRANRIRPFLKKYGAKGAIERALAADSESSTYELLKAAGLHDLSFESTVVRFPDEFATGVVDRAKANLAAWG